MRKIDKQNKVTVKELEEMASKMFGNLVKAVIDIDKQIAMIDADMHADEEAELIKEGSKQQDLWGINLYPELFGTDDFIEYDSMINNSRNSSGLCPAMDRVSRQGSMR